MKQDAKEEVLDAYRELGDREYVIDCNLGKERRRAYAPGKAFELVFPRNVEDTKVLEAYEARIWRKR